MRLCGIFLGMMAWMVWAQTPPVIRVSKQGADKDALTLSVRTTGANGANFLKNLTKDLEYSGLFKLGGVGAFAVEGGVSENADSIRTALVARGPGKRFEWNRVAKGDKEIRLCAHQLSDAILREFFGKKGNACSEIAFVRRLGADNAELCICDANGFGARQVTADHAACVGPRWAPDGKTIYYTSFMRGYPEIFRCIPETRERKPLAAFRGLNTGAVASPDGRRIAMILSYQGNPELYVLNKASGFLQRMTKTPRGAEASPTWSPDGSSIVYVSDLSGKPQLYLVNVATRRSRRITFEGAENTDPDWGANGQLAYISKRSGGARVLTMRPQDGDSAAKKVDAPWGAEHPSWAPDGRHLVCSAQGALYLLDSEGDEPERLINLKGDCCSPDWSDQTK